ncbi:MAG: DNA polymerase III subunit alpha [Alphaproteobacteria bacterium]|nr:DNA polymerase III subunit alpha [Alphaproteobacteria bacterium]
MQYSQKYIHLRCRSSYSLAQGAIKIDDLIELAKDYSMPALALTDNGNLFGALEFSIKAAKNGIQPIIGSILEIEIKSNDSQYVDANKCKILLLVKNTNGWKNLSYLVSKSFIDNIDGLQAPILLDDLFSHSDGLICLLGGIHGPLMKYITSEKNYPIDKIINLFKKHFPDRLFMEIMRHGLEQEKIYENTFLKLAQEYSIPILATNNIYFNSSDMYDAHDCLMCISGGTTISDANRRRITKDHYFKNQEEMIDLFSDLPNAISNSLIIANKCSFLMEEQPPTLPSYPKKLDKTEYQTLINDSEVGLKQRLKTLDIDKNKENIYFERLSYELDVISSMGFSGYFLIVAEFVNWAKENNIPVGPGRGSGAGSLVAWSLGITGLDPIEYNLLFERFLNPERISMPDFDIDFCQSKRDEVIRHVQNIYGNDRVAQIITFGSLQARGALRDVGRVLEIPYGKVDELCRLVPNNPASPTTLKEALDIEPKLSLAIQSGEEISQLFEISLKLEGLLKNAATHAAGLVIGDKPLVEIIPLYKDPKSNIPSTQYNMKYTELSGLVKFDFLGLKTLSILDMASSLLSETDSSFKLEDIPLDDVNTYKEISTGETTGIFQLESKGMRDVLSKLKPDRFEDIIAVVALYRPGPMDNIPSFINRKHGLEKVEVLHPLLNSILEETYGIMIYQEQVMEAAQKLANYTLGQADILRRAMGKKIKTEMDAQRENFIQGSLKNNINKNLSSQIFDLIARFAGYGFNKSHAAAYALIAYQTAWFKTNHPEIFLSALMTFDSDLADKINIYRNELNRLDINLLGPDINYSIINYSLEHSSDGKIAVRAGLCSIKNIGNKALSIVVEERKRNGLFKSLLEFANRIDSSLLGKSHYENLSLAGAFNSVNINRRQTFMSAQVLVDLSIVSSGDKSNQQENIFGSEINLDEIWKLPDVDDWNYKEKLERERTSLGFYYSGHPLDYSKKFLDQLDIIDISLINESSETIVNTVGVVMQVIERSSKNGRFARLIISSTSSLQEVIIYSDIYVEKKFLLKLGTELYLKIAVTKDNNGTSRLLVRDLWPLEAKLNELTLSLEINLKNNVNINSFISDLKSIIIQDKKYKKYPIHIIFNDGESNLVKIETHQYIKSALLFKERFETSQQVLSVNPILKI